MGSIAIHASQDIAWHKARCQQFLSGLRALGFDPIVTSERERVADYSILFGTTLWRGIEKEGDFLLVDRASLCDPDYVQLVWNGHGRRGDHCVPDKRSGRRIEVPFKPWQTGSRVVLCGQTETYSPNYERLTDWYSQVKATHFRRHPVGDNPTGLPEVRDWDDCGLCVTLNSSVGVEAVMNGVPTVTMDYAAMAWDVTGHTPDEIMTPYRGDWLEWLAWTQWHWSEIESGDPIKHLFERL